MMHIKTALMVYLFGALVLTGCASSSAAPTIRATAIPSPSPTAVTPDHATAGKARVARPSTLAKPKVAGAKQSGVAISGVKRGVPATEPRRISQYIQDMLAAANTQ